MLSSVGTTPYGSINLTVVNSLIAAGAVVNLANSSGNTPIHLATYKGHSGIVETLRASVSDS